METLDRVRWEVEGGQGVTTVLRKDAIFAISIHTIFLSASSADLGRKICFLCCGHKVQNLVPGGTISTPSLTEIWGRRSFSPDVKAKGDEEKDQVDFLLSDCENMVALFPNCWSFRERRVWYVVDGRRLLPWYHVNRPPEQELDPYEPTRLFPAIFHHSFLQGRGRGIIIHYLNHKLEGTETSGKTLGRRRFWLK